MTLRERIGALERAHTTEPAGVALDLSKLGPAALTAMAEAYGESLDRPDDFLPALLVRIGAAQDAGTYPQSLSDADLLALLCAFDAMEGKTLPTTETTVGKRGVTHRAALRKATPDARAAHATRRHGRRWRCWMAKPKP